MKNIGIEKNSTMYVKENTNRKAIVILYYIPCWAFMHMKVVYLQFESENWQMKFQCSKEFGSI